MMFHIFFLTVTIARRPMSSRELERAYARQLCEEQLEKSKYNLMKNYPFL